MGRRSRGIAATLNRAHEECASDARLGFQCRPEGNEQRRTLSCGETFETFAELKTLLLTTRKRQIVRNIVERTLSYAVCRKLELHDRPMVDIITNRLIETDGTYRQLIQLVANSPQIRNTAFRD